MKRNLILPEVYSPAAYGVCKASRTSTYLCVESGLSSLPVHTHLQRSGLGKGQHKCHSFLARWPICSCGSLIDVNDDYEVLGSRWARDSCCSRQGPYHISACVFPGKLVKHF